MHKRNQYVKDNQTSSSDHFPSDDEELLTAIVKDVSKEKKFTTTFGVNDKLLVANKPISSPGTSLPHISQTPDISTRLIASKPVKPAPPGVTFKRRRLEGSDTIENNSNTDTLNDIFHSEDPRESGSNNAQLTKINTMMIESSCLQEEVVSDHITEKQRETVRLVRGDLKSNLSFDDLFPEYGDGDNKVKEEWRVRKEILPEPLVTNIETIDDIFS